MSKTLILFRHGKSDRSIFNLNDFERPINDRGKRQVPLMARELAKHQIVPEFIFASPAKRTKQTAKLIIETNDWANLFYHDELYLPLTSELLSFIQLIPDTIPSAMIVGHNPALTDMVEKLTSSRLDNLPTAGYLIFSLPSWEKPENGELLHLNYPKKAQID